LAVTLFSRHCEGNKKVREHLQYLILFRLDERGTREKHFYYCADYLENQNCWTAQVEIFFMDHVKNNPLDAQHILSIFRFQSNQDNRELSNKNNKYQLLYTYGCTSWWCG